MNPDDVFYKWDKVKCEAIPVRDAAKRCSLVDSFNFGTLRMVSAASFSPRIQKSVSNKISKRLKDWPKDDNGDFVLDNQ